MKLQVDVDLKEILIELGLRKLPEKETENEIWTVALAEIIKRNGMKSYCLLRRRYDMSYYVSKMYGSISALVKIEKIYPYKLLDKKFIQGFSTNSIEDRVDFLKKLDLPYANQFNFDEMNLQDLNKAIVGAAIYLQQKTETENNGK